MKKDVLGQQWIQLKTGDKHESLNFTEFPEDISFLKNFQQHK